MTAASGSYVWSPHEETTVVQPIARPRVGPAAALLALGLLALLLLVVPGAIVELDGQSMFQVTQSIVTRGDVGVSPPRNGTAYGVPGLDGHWYSKYGPAQSLLAAPLYLAGRALAPLVPAYYRPELPTLAAALLPALATAVTALLLALAAVELGASRRGALVLAAVYVFATPAAVYATQWFSEALTACALLATVYLLLRDRSSPAPWRPLLAGVTLAVAVATRFDALLYVLPLALYALIQRESRASRLLSFLLPLGVTLIGLGLYDAARFGSPLETGYSKGDYYAYRDTHPPHTLASLANGLYGLLLSPGEGLLAYAPPALLAPFGAATLWARRRAETALLLSLFLLDLVGHANVLIRWVGGWSWGPRFLVPTLPLVLLLLAPLLRSGSRRDPVQQGAMRPRPPRCGPTSWGPTSWGPTSWEPSRWRRLVRPILAALAVAGVLVQAPALLTHEPHTYIYDLRPRYCRHGDVLHCPRRDGDRLEHDYLYLPAMSPIVGSWRLLFEPATWTPQTRVAPTLVADQSVTVAPNTWWRLLSLQDVPALPLALACALLLILALACSAGALRLTREAGP